MTRKKLVIVTGASGHLGKAVVDRLRKEDVPVMAVVSPRSKGETDRARNVETVKADALDEAAVESIVRDAAGKHGGIHGLVATIGGFAAGPLGQTRFADLDRMVRLNFYTTFAFARPVCDVMRESGGRLVFVGSKPALNLAEGKDIMAYALSKAMVHDLATCINADSATTGIHASVLVPDTIDTPVNRKAMPDADFSKWISPGDIAEKIWKLLSGPDGVHDPVIKMYGDS